MAAFTKERDMCMYNFCKLVCPNFLKRQNPKRVVSVIANDLEKIYGADVKELYSQAERFVAEHPKGIFIAEETPPRLRGDLRYRKEASNIIEKYTGIKIPPVAAVFSTFYEEIIKHCLISSMQEPLFKYLNLNE